MKIKDNPLLCALRCPQISADFSLSDWDRCLRMARHHRVLPRLSFLIEETDLISRIDPKVQEHLYAARAIGAQHERIVRWETGRIERALESTSTKIVLLKGAAYVMAMLPPARGRFYSDVDIMVPFDKLGPVESALLKHGWEPMKLAPYDQRYYRKWMHELPPLRHKERKTLLDVHHTILPRTGRLHPDPERLFETVVRIGDSNLWTLSPPDMVLHSAAHMFQDGDLAGGLRDLTDLDDLLQHFGACQDCFWEDLIARAKILAVSRPLFYALRYTEKILGTPVPDWAIRASEFGAPQRLMLKLMDHLVSRALIPSEPVATTRGAALARWCLYVRSHYLKMPPHLLLFHLLRKSTMRIG
jgi:hypothetical protein